MPSSAKFYYAIRKEDPSRMDSIARAARFVYLNRNCFNGVYRTNREGTFNVPRGKRTGDVPPPNQFRECAKLLRNSNLYAGDFEFGVSQAKYGDLVYLDPPYAIAANLEGGEYGYASFRPTDFERFRDSVCAASARGAKVLISFADVAPFRNMFSTWHQKKLRVSRHIGGFRARRSVANEVLISNYPIP